MKCLSTVSFPQDVQHQKYQGVVWDIAIYWVVPLPSNTGKWRFGWEFPNLNMWCLASCEWGDNRQPSVKMPSLTAVFSDTSAVFGGTFTEAASGDFKGLSAGWGLFLLPRTPKKTIDPHWWPKKGRCPPTLGLKLAITAHYVSLRCIFGFFFLVKAYLYIILLRKPAGRLGGDLPCERSENIEGVWGSGVGTNTNGAYCGK